MPADPVRILVFKILVVLASLAVSVVLFFLFIDIVGFSILMVILLPVIVTGFLFGFWAGGIAGLLSFPLIASVLSFANLLNWSEIFRTCIPETVVFVGVGFLIGRVTDANRKLTYEVEQKKQLEGLYKTLIDTSPDAITTTDLDGIITFTSAQTAKIHGFAHKEEIIGKNALELIAPEDREKAKLNLAKTLHQGKVENVSYLLLKKDGTTFPGQLSASLIKDPGGKPRSFVAVIKDVSQAQKLEVESKKRLAELEGLNKLMVGREVRMAELKQRLRQLESRQL